MILKKKWFEINDRKLFVKTLEGTSYKVTNDDYIIRGVITKFENNLMIFESIWLKPYFQYYEQRLTCDYDPSVGGDIFYKDFPTFKKLY